jgi:hypothetical protein
MVSIFELGMNCHLKTRTSHLTKQIEIEKLYDSIKQKQSSSDLRILDEEELRCDLKQIGLRRIVDHNKDLLTKDQYRKIKEFSNREDVIIRRADKSNTFVIMKSETYKSKLNDIVNDPEKFQKIRKDPTENIKKRLNTLVEVVNATQSVQHLKKLEGHYEPGYLYGNPKIHKTLSDPPLRPIISQIGTPVYEISKTLNNIITKFMPKEHVIDSTYEFVEICKTIEQPKCLASLDVESLFTNVPVRDTVQIILDNVYGHPTIRPPNIPKPVMEEMLLICTTQCPFRGTDGQLFVQCDGVSMGSPLGPTFANYYMCHLENGAFRTLQTKPVTYCRYVDDCFLVINNFSELQSLKSYFEANSVLTFTYEIETCKTLHFLDVNLSRTGTFLDLGVYTKPTNTDECLNFESLCPIKYKTSVLRTFLHRAYAVTSSWDNFDTEIRRIKNLLVNNGFPIQLVDQNISKFLQSKLNPINKCVEPKDITLMYRNQFTSTFKHDEQNLKRVISKNVTTVDPAKKVQLLIYYQNRKLKSLLIRNKLHKSNADARVVYQYECNEVGCHSNKYIGYTTCSLAKRFYMHVQSGAIRFHNKNAHNVKPLTRQLLQCTKVIYRGQSKNDLTIAEALLIKKERPTLNLQDEGLMRVLKIF